MDSYRTAWEDGFGGDVNDDDADDDFIADTPPVMIGQDERRMQVRAYNHWASLLGERTFPKITEFALSDHPDFAENAVLLDFAKGYDHPRIAYVGDALAAESAEANELRQLADVPRSSLLSRITDHYMQIIANEAPIGFEAEFVSQAGATLLYRGILLPFADDGKTISQILGVINWKQLADQAMTDQLMAEIDSALAEAPGPAISHDSPDASQLPEAPAAPSVSPLADAHYDAWADGPSIGLPPAPDPGAEDNVLDLGLHPELSEGALDWPEPGFSCLDDEAAVALPSSLGDVLGEAREFALLAAGAEDRSHQALYAAISRAWDFALAAQAAPADYAALLAEAGLVAQERAQFTPQLKLVFGAGYDKTRLAEYAAVLAHAERLELEQGALGDHIANYPAGLKGVVQAERAQRRGDAPAKPRSAGPGAALARKLRRLAPVELAALRGEGAEFTLLVARRDADGVVVLGEAEADQKLVARLARGLVAGK